MLDAYKILGVSPNASDEEVKRAYKELVKKYHPDQYSENPLFDLAADKMKEINEAYEQIMNERKNKYNNYANYSSNSNNYNYYHGFDSQQVRQLLMNNRIQEAEQFLDNVNLNNRDAQWYFLKGTVQMRKGWLEEAYNNVSTACRMDPNNLEYRALLNQMDNQRRGVYGGYNRSQDNMAGCNSCDACSALICTDCCCECMGGDFIRCC